MEVKPAEVLIGDMLVLGAFWVLCVSCSLEVSSKTWFLWNGSVSFFLNLLFLLQLNVGRLFSWYLQNMEYLSLVFKAIRSFSNLSNLENISRFLSRTDKDVRGLKFSSSPSFLHKPTSKIFVIMLTWWITLLFTSGFHFILHLNGFPVHHPLVPSFLRIVFLFFFFFYLIHHFPGRFHHQTDFADLLSVC